MVTSKNACEVVLPNHKHLKKFAPNSFFGTVVPNSKNFDSDVKNPRILKWEVFGHMRAVNRTFE